MAENTLIAAAIFSLISGAVYVFVGHRVLQRPTSPDARLASKLFAVWWFGLGATSLTGSVSNVTAAIAPPSLALFQAYTYLVLAVLCVALWGLLYYLLFLFTGRRWIIGPLSAFYVVFFGILTWAVLNAHPTGVDVGRWAATLRYQEPIGGPLLATLLGLLLFPQIIGALAYFTLYFQLEDPVLRFRVAVVSWSIIVWFASAFLANVAGLGQADWWQVLSRLFGLGAALATLIAFSPPRRLRERLGMGTGDAATAMYVAPSGRGSKRDFPAGAARKPRGVAS